MDTFQLSMDHIGWAVADIDMALPAMEALGFRSCGTPCEDMAREVKILLLKNREGCVIELVAPLSGNANPVANLLAKSGPTPYHCCFSAGKERFAAQMESLKKTGFVPITPQLSAPALDNDEVVFLYSKHVGLIELVQRTN